MAITLDGTTGITTPGLTNTGSETVVNLTTTGNTILGDASTDTLNVGNGNLVTDASGNVGVGVTPSAWGGTGVKALDVAVSTSIAGSAGSADMYGNAYYNGSNFVFKANGYAFRYQQNIGSGFHAWSTSNNGSAGGTPSFTQAMTLNASGQLILGDTTADGRLKVVETAAGAGVTFYNSANNSAGQIGTTNEAGAANSLEINAYRGSGRIVFKTNNTYAASIDSSGRLLLGTTTVGTDGPRITVANSNNSQTWQLGTISSFTPFYVYNNSSVGVYITNGGTSWTSSSDERVKDIIEPIENAITKVSALRTVIGKYKTDEEGTRRSFLIAQDVQAVFPEAVNVQEDEQGTLGLQYTEIIPLLVAAIKEQQALITTLTDRITALENK